MCMIPDAETRERSLVYYVKVLARRSENLPLKKLIEVLNHEAKAKSKGTLHYQKLIFHRIKWT